MIFTMQDKLNLFTFICIEVVVVPVPGINWIALAEYSLMSNHVPGFQSFIRLFASFYTGQISLQQHKYLRVNLPSLFDMSETRPLRQASVISAMLLAQRPIACIVAAANSLSELVTYV